MRNLLLVVEFLECGRCFLSGDDTVAVAVELVEVLAVVFSSIQAAIAITVIARCS